MGRYEGRSVVELLDDGRRVRVVEPFAFVDSAESRWDVPVNATVDGASIPQMFWSIIGGPFEGKYRNASIIHDWYCEVRTRKWKEVHRMFHEAMLVSGVSWAKANLMFAAVYHGGPRWSDTTVENSRLAFGTTIKSVAASSSGHPVILTATDPRKGDAYRRTAAKRSPGGPDRWRTTASPARVKKPRVYRPKMDDSDLEALRSGIGGKRMNARDIEHMVDSMFQSKAVARTK